MYSILKIAVFLVVCKVSFIFGQNLPPWLEFVGLTSTKAYYLSNSNGPTLDVAEAKFECWKYNMRLATLDTEAIPLINDFLIYKYGLNTTSPEIWTSARFATDFSTNVSWTTGGDPVPESMLRIMEIVPGDNPYFWYECPPLKRICLKIQELCNSDPASNFFTGIIHDLYYFASSNCLVKKIFLCQKER